MKKIKTFIDINENGDTTCHNLWDAEKAILTGKFTAINVHVKKQENVS